MQKSWRIRMAAAAALILLPALVIAQSGLQQLNIDRSKGPIDDLPTVLGKIYSNEQYIQGIVSAKFNSLSATAYAPFGTTPGSVADGGALTAEAGRAIAAEQSNATGIANLGTALGGKQPLSANLTALSAFTGVGTGPNTLAAGNDSRIVGATQNAAAAITGGAINGATIGATAPAPANVTSLAITGSGSTGDVSGMSVRPAGATVTNTLTALLGRTVYVTDFMPVGTSDITAALPAAIAALPANGGTVRIPATANCYSLTAPVTVTTSGIQILGDGRLSSCIQTNFQGDVITAGTGDTINNFVTRDVSFRSSVARTSGAAVKLVNTYNSTVADISCDTNPYICTDVVGPASSSVAGGPNSYNIKLHRIHTTSPTYVGIRVGYGNTTGLCPADVHIDTPNLGPATRAGIEIQCSGGFQIVSGDVIGSGVGMLLDPGNNQQVAAGITTGLYLDTSTNAGLKIAPTGTGQVADTTFSSLWAASNGLNNGAPGVLVQGTATSVRSVTFNALRGVNNGGEAIRVEGGAYIDINAPQIGFNSRYAAATYSGIYLGAGVSHVGIAAGRSGAGSSFTQTNIQKYGVEIASGAGDYISIAGTDLSGNQTGAISNGATGTNQVIMPLGASAGILGGNFGVGTKTPFSPLSVAGPAHAYSDAQFGLAGFQFSTGSAGQFDMSLMGGVNDTAGSQYTWLQSGKPGTGNYPLYLNPNGGPVMLGRPSPPTTNAGDYLPYVPVMAGTPTATPTAVTGMTPIVIDGTNGKLCAYVNSAWKCATLQ